MTRRRRALLRWTGLGVLGLLAAATFGGCALSAPRWKGPRSDHFDGERFLNQERSQGHAGFGDFLRWQLQRERGAWNDYVEQAPGPRPPERVGRGELRVTYVNHATTLIQVDGLNLLTDPIYSHRASPFSWVGPARHVAPGVRFEDLPPIDAVLVGHNHYDHCDLPTLKRLAGKWRPKIFAGLGNAQLFGENAIPNATDLDWWQSAELSPEVKVTSVPVQHFSGRGLSDRDGTLWTGYVIEGPAGKVFFASDTGMGPHFQQIRARFGPMRLAVLPIGAFRPEWFMSYVHVSPEQALEAHAVLEAGTSVGMHFGTFNLADDGQFEPAHRVKLLLEAAPEPKPNFWVLGFGEGRDVPPLAQ